MELTQQQVKDIITKAPQGTTPQGILAGLRTRGYTFQGYPTQTQPVLPTRPVPGEETAWTPAKPMSEVKTYGSAATEGLKIIPNALKDVGTLAKELTWGTARKIAYDIPKEIVGLVKDSGGFENAVKNYQSSFGEASKELAWGLVPQSLKEIANTDAISKIPQEFQGLVKESGGYVNAVKEMMKATPEAFKDLPKAYGEQINRAEQAFVNHPVQEALAYFMLKNAIQNPRATMTEVNKSIKTTGEFMRNPIKSTGEAMADAKVKGQTLIKGLQEAKVKKGNEKIVSNRETELQNIENNYAKTRKQAQYSKDANAGTRKRIAETDVLADAVDENGLVRTKQPGGAIEQYKSQTIDGAENVVKQNLHRMGEKVNLKVVEKQLIKAVNESGLQGKNLTNALSNIRKEIAGYRLKADARGDVLVELMHDAKIDTTNSINYQTPPEIKTYNKAIARGLKEVVENNSSVPVKEINAELGKYLQDIKYLENLDGARVRGGKLGKYFSQVGGNIAGGAAGSMVGGIPGGAIGTVVGGEVARIIKGKQLKGTLGGKTGNVAPKSEIINKAVETGQSPRNLPARIPGRDYTPAGPSKSRSGQVLPQYKPIQMGEGTTYEPQSRGRITNAQNQYMGKPISKPSKNVIKDSVPKAKDTVKGGLSLRDVSKIHPEDQAVMRDYIDSVRLNKETPKQLALDAENLRNHFGITDVSATKLADHFDTLLANLKKNPLPPRKPSLPKEAPLDPSKYETAEEFVKAQANYVHGGGGEIGKFDARKLTKGGELGKGVYFTGDEARAKLYGGTITNLKANLKNPLTITSKELWSEGGIIDKFNADPSYTKKLIEQGYDGIIVKNGDKVDQGVVFDVKNVLTKSQLTDLFNKSKGKEVGKVELKPTKLEDNSKYYDIQSGGKKVGEVETLKGYFGKDDLHIQFIGVDKPFRRGGLGTETLKKILRDTDAKTISAEPTNKAAYEMMKKTLGKPLEISNDIMNLTEKEFLESLPDTAKYINGELDSTSRGFVRWSLKGLKK